MATFQFPFNLNFGLNLGTILDPYIPAMNNEAVMVKPLGQSEIRWPLVWCSLQIETLVWPLNTFPSSLEQSLTVSVSGYVWSSYSTGLIDWSLCGLRVQTLCYALQLTRVCACKIGLVWSSFYWMESVSPKIPFKCTIKFFINVSPVCWPPTFCLEFCFYHDELIKLSKCLEF